MLASVLSSSACAKDHHKWQTHSSDAFPLGEAGAEMWHTLDLCKTEDVTQNTIFVPGSNQNELLSFASKDEQKSESAAKPPSPFAETKRMRCFDR